METTIQHMREAYRRDGIVKISRDLFPALPTPVQVQVLGDDVIALALSGSDASMRIDSSVEMVKVLKGNLADLNSCSLETKAVLTRLENFVSSSEDWTKLCCTGGILSQVVGAVCAEDEGEEQENWCLYKEKLNIKPAGATGYAPHLDNPSLQVTGLCDHFVTLMLAIDDMTVENGCLRVVKGQWSPHTAGPLCAEVDASTDANPDRDGRRGALRPEVADGMEWEDLECQSGDVYVFNGWIPHRSGANTTQLPRRSVFLTYNCPEDGELRDDYYRIMRITRANFAEKQKKLHL